MNLSSAVATTIGAATLATGLLGSSPESKAARGADSATTVPYSIEVDGPSAEMRRIPEDTDVTDIWAPALEQTYRRFGRKAFQFPASAALLEIDLVFHVLSGPLSEGDLSEDILIEQMSVLNDAYRPAGFHFNLAEVRRYPDSPYFSGGCFPTTEEGIRMKSELAIDPKRFVNVYSCRLALPYIAGYGTLPNEYPESDSRHGIVIDYDTVPGSAPPLSLGHTLVHELGHYFGLLHTFQGGCAEPDDDVSDTPAEAIPGYGCLLGRDSCPQEGMDPVSNFMDYSDDTCTDNFTPLQSDRMQTLTAIYRPGLARPAATVPAHRVDLRRFDLIFGDD